MTPYTVYLTVRKSDGEDEMTTQNAGVVARRPDISTALYLECLTASNFAGETIDGLIDRLTQATGIVLSNDEDRKGFIAVVNVRKSNLKKSIKGEFQAERSDLEKQLVDMGGGTNDECNAIREEIRTLNKNEQTMLDSLDLARRGRTGDKPGVSIRSLLADAVLKSKSDVEV